MAYTVKSLEAHLDATQSPKRILTLDGGGVRGMLTLSYLKKIEDVLRERHGGDENFRLSDYFDLIAGTSTGAIIASTLAMGKSVSFIQEKYRELASNVFKSHWSRLGIFRARYDSKALERALKDLSVLGPDTTMGSPALKTGLLIIVKRMDTNSTWTLNNNPKGKYFNRRPGGTSIPNADFPLWRVVRSSTAAPFYFKPESFTVATSKEFKPVAGDFVDGGVSTANNPALKAFQLVTMNGYNLNWATGARKMLLVSVGTGHRSKGERISGFYMKNTLKALISIMADCNELVETQMQWYAQSDTYTRIDREMGTLENDFIAGKPLLTYQRYNTLLEEKWFKESLGCEDYSDEILEGLTDMANARNLEMLAKVGAIAGEQQIQPAHFPKGFDLK